MNRRDPIDSDLPRGGTVAAYNWRRRFWQLKVLVTLVLVLVLTGCATGEGDAGSTIAEVETTAHSVEETTVLRGEGNLPRPPDSTLSHSGREARASIGSYCWFDGESEASAYGGCVDMPYITLPKQQTLTVPSGSDMVFRYGGHKPPKTVENRV